MDESQLAIFLKEKFLSTNFSWCKIPFFRSARSGLGFLGIPGVQLKSMIV